MLAKVCHNIHILNTFLSHTCLYFFKDLETRYIYIYVYKMLFKDAIKDTLDLLKSLGDLFQKNLFGFSGFSAFVVVFVGAVGIRGDGGVDAGREAAPSQPRGVPVSVASGEIATPELSALAVALQAFPPEGEAAALATVEGALLEVPVDAARATLRLRRLRQLYEQRGVVLILKVNGLAAEADVVLEVSAAVVGRPRPESLE